MNITTSKIFSLNWLDIAKGAIMSAGTAAATAIQQALDKGSITAIDWKLVAMAAVGGLLTYLIKNFFSHSKVIIKADKQE